MSILGAVRRRVVVGRPSHSRAVLQLGEELVEGIAQGIRDGEAALVRHEAEQQGVMVWMRAEHRLRRVLDERERAEGWPAAWSWGPPAETEEGDDW